MAEKVRKTKMGYELETCSRCGGSGNHSFCQMYGSTCFKCGGTGVVLSKKGAATHNYFIEITSKPASLVKVGDLLRTDRWLVVKEIGNNDGKMVTIINGVRKEESRIGFELVNKDGSKAIGYNTSLESSVRSVKNDGEWEQKHKQAMEYQDKLTKGGKLMKKHQPRWMAIK